MTTQTKVLPASLRLPSLVLAGSLLAASLAPLSALAAPPPPPVVASPAPTPALAKGGLNLNMGMNEIDKVLAKADATPEQTTKIKAIILDAFVSMGAQGPALKSTAQAFGKSLMAPRVNRADLESARVSAVADFDAFSKVMVKALADAADVLTAEQRAKLTAKTPKPPA